MVRRLIVAVLSVMVLSTTACSDDEEPVTGGDSSSQEPDGESAPTSDESPTEPEDPESSDDGSQAATGPELAVATFKVSAPTGWRASGGNATTITGISPQGIDNIILYSVSDFGMGERPIDRLAKEALDSGTWQKKPKIVEPVEAGGTDLYHLSGPISSSQYLDEYGALVGGQEIRISMTQAMFVPAAKRQELAASVIASLELL